MEAAPEAAPEAAGVVRLRHCGAAIFCRRPPPLCPACGRPLRGAGLAAAPVRLPCPFRHGHRQRRALVLRPSAGTFLGYGARGSGRAGRRHPHGSEGPGPRFSSGAGRREQQALRRGRALLPARPRSALNAVSLSEDTTGNLIFTLE